MKANPSTLQKRAACAAEKVVGMVTQAFPPDLAGEDAPGTAAGNLDDASEEAWPAWEAALEAVVTIEAAANTAERRALQDQLSDVVSRFRESTTAAGYALGLAVGLRLAALVHNGGAR